MRRTRATSIPHQRRPIDGRQAFATAAAKLLTHDEARRIAANIAKLPGHDEARRIAANIAKLPELLPKTWIRR